MRVINKVPELVAAKFGGADKINYTQIETEMGMNYRTVTSWVKGHVERADFEVLAKWCKYLGVKTGDILVYEE
jgi:DNA-binding Xre family transcriptional regulator